MSSVAEKDRSKSRAWSAPELDFEVIHYRNEGGVALIEMDVPPANTDT